MSLLSSTTSLLVLADRLGIDRVLTLDRRHFAAVRTPSGTDDHALTPLTEASRGSMSDA